MDMLIITFGLAACVAWLAGVRTGRRWLLGAASVLFLLLSVLLVRIDETTVRLSQLGMVLLGVGLVGFVVLLVGKGKLAGDKWVIRAELAIILFGLLFLISS